MFPPSHPASPKSEQSEPGEEYPAPNPYADHLDDGIPIREPEPPPAPPVATPVDGLTLGAIRALLFGFDDLWDCHLQSWHRGDPYAPRIVPRELYSLLRHLDPDELVLHFEVYATHCEVWHADHWQRSDSRRSKVLATSAERAERQRTITVVAANNELRQEIYRELLRVMGNILDESTLQRLSSALATADEHFWNAQQNVLPASVVRLWRQWRDKMDAVPQAPAIQQSTN